MVQENTEKFSIFFVVTAGLVKREQHVVNGKVSLHMPFHFLSVSLNIVIFAVSFLKCDNEPSTNSLQDAMIQVRAGVEVWE